MIWSKSNIRLRLQTINIFPCSVLPSIEHPEPPESDVADGTPSYAEKRRTLEHQKTIAELGVQAAQERVRKIGLEIESLELREREKELERIARSRGIDMSSWTSF